MGWWRQDFEVLFHYVLSVSNLYTEVHSFYPCRELSKFKTFETSQYDVLFRWCGICFPGVVDRPKRLTNSHMTRFNISRAHP